MTPAHKRELKGDAAKGDADAQQGDQMSPIMMIGEGVAGPPLMQAARMRRLPPRAQLPQEGGREAVGDGARRSQGLDWALLSPSSALRRSQPSSEATATSIQLRRILSS